MTLHRRHEPQAKFELHKQLFRMDVIRNRMQVSSNATRLDTKFQLKIQSPFNVQVAPRANRHRAQPTKVATWL